MKTKQSVLRFLTFLLCLCFSIMFAACSAMSPDHESDSGVPENFLPQTGDEFTEFSENDFIKASVAPVSYFSLDISTASYAVVRNYINKGLTLDKNSVKTEEMINYFKYSYPKPQAGEPLSLSGDIFPCPWNSENLLLNVGIRTKDIEFESIKNNLVFLIDTSGSMDSPDKLGLLQEAFSILADNINDDDTVSIVTYAGSSVTALDGAKGAERMRIKNIVSDLSAGGSTAGAGGIERAYALAEKHFIAGGNNRVILATDGDFNVGISSQEGLKEFIINKRSQSKGVYLSIMGFGLGNLKSTTMDTLAQNGNGTAYYIDGILEAKKVMSEELKGTLVTVADDVKAGVEFNPDKIEKYKLLGYETKLLGKEDFENDSADAGELGAGQTVTAVYEIVLAKNAESVSENMSLGNNFVKAAVRYKEPYSGERPENDAREVKEISLFLSGSDILSDEEFIENEDLMFISAVIESALIFRNSADKAGADLNKVIEKLEGLDSVTTDEYREDFLKLLKTYKQKYLR